MPREEFLERINPASWSWLAWFCPQTGRARCNDSGASAPDGVSCMIPTMMNAPTRHPVVQGFLITLCLVSGPAVLKDVRTAAADSPAPAAAVVTGQKDCRGVDSKLARKQAEAAAHRSQYQQAGQCYLAAGDKPRADLAFVKAAAAEGAVTKRKLAVNANQAKQQFRQLREAFASH